MKKNSILIFILIILLSFTSCSKEKTPVEEAKEVAQKYMTILYDVEDFTEYKAKNFSMEKMVEVEEKLKPYITSTMFKSLRANREIIFIHWAAIKRQRNIAMDNIEFELQSSKDDKLYFKYKAKISLTSINSKKEYKEKEGQVGLVKLNNEWKVNNYKSFNYPFEVVKCNRYNIKTKSLYDIKNTAKNNIYSELKAYVNVMFFTINNTTDEKLRLKFPSSKLYELILYKDGNEIWRYGDEISSFGQKTVFDVLEKGESMVFCLDYPFTVDSGEYEYEFYINAEGWENKEHLKGKITIDK